MIRWLVILVFLANAAIAQEAIAPEDVRLELSIEARDHPPHPGEMILLSIHGTFLVPVVREKLRQPPLPGFDWMQLGGDRWYKDFESGFEVLKFERRMALFPQAAGEIEIPAFTHELDVLTRDGETVSIVEVSNTRRLAAAPRPGADQWWFPVRRIEVSDTWSNAPEALETGHSALRTVTLTVEGSAPQRVPPMPELTGAGAYIFPHPEHRIVSLGPNGPVTRVFWRWTVRPLEATAGYLDPIELAYFDTEERVGKRIRLSAQRIAHVIDPQGAATGGNGVGTATPGPAVADIPPVLPGWSVAAALAVGALSGLCFGLLGTRGGTLRRPGWKRTSREVSLLRRAARRGDPLGVRRHARALLPPGKAPLPEVLSQLDRALYGSGAPMPDLRSVARAVAAAVSSGGRA